MEERLSITRAAIRARRNRSMNGFIISTLIGEIIARSNIKVKQLRAIDF
jgi:hypothetical protein